MIHANIGPEAAAGGISCLWKFCKTHKNNLCQSLFLIQLKEKETPAQLVFSMNFAKFLRTRYHRTPLGDYLYWSWREVVRDVLTLLLMTNFKECQTLKTYFAMQNLIYIYTFYICIHILYTYTIYLDVHILFIYIHSTFADYLLFSFFLFCFFFFTIYLYYLFTHHCYLLPAY